MLRDNIEQAQLCLSILQLSTCQILPISMSFSRLTGGIRNSRESPRRRFLSLWFYHTQSIVRRRDRTDAPRTSWAPKLHSTFYTTDIHYKWSKPLSAVRHKFIIVKCKPLIASENLRQPTSTAPGSVIGVHLRGFSAFDVLLALPVLFLATARARGTFSALSSAK